MGKQTPSDVHEEILRAFFADEPPGVMVDVGAARPLVLSNSAPYRARGWRVVSVEPNPVFCAEHRAYGLAIVQCACADHDAEDVPFTLVELSGSLYRGARITYEAYSSLGMPDYYESRLKEIDQAVRRREISVKVRRLDRILQEHAIERVDVLSIVAGEWELAVLRGFSIDRYRPRVVSVDNVAGDASRAEYLEPRGYAFWRQFGPKQVFVRAQ